MKKSIHLLFFILSSFTGFGQAAQIVGGSIRYEALDNNKYKVIANVNRLCNGEALQTPTLQVFTANNNFNLTLTRIKIEDVTLRCKNNLNPCNPQNTKTAEGIEQHTFEANIDFNTMPYSVFKNNGNCEVFFGLTGDKRSDSINTLTTKGNFYIEAMIDLCVLGNANNTSATINGSSYNISYINMPYTNNQSTYDRIDEDSIAYSLISAKNGANSNEIYKIKLSKRIPLTPYCLPTSGNVDCPPLPNAKPPRGFYFDSLTGDFTLTPTKYELGVVVIKIIEYRKINNVYVLIGYTTQEICINVKDFGYNNEPRITNTSNKYSICEGEKLCFNITTEDLPYLPKQTVPDTIVSLTWNFGIPSATFRITNPNEREKIAEFCWQTKLGDARNKLYNFSVIAKDDFCPTPAQSVKIFSINVKPKAKSSSYYLRKDKILVFENYPLNKELQTYEWTIKDSTNTGTILKKSFNQKDSFIFNNYGKYYITRIVNNPPINCPTTYLDSIIIDGRNTSNINDFTVKLKKIIVYPNPAKKIITIQINPNETYLKLKIYNAIGKEIYNGTMQQNINVSEFTNGIYTLLVESDKGIYTTQMIKE